MKKPRLSVYLDPEMMAQLAELAHRTILRRQPDLRSYGNHPNIESRVSLP